MDGPLTLLLTWAWIRLPFLAPIPSNPRVFPIATRWRNSDRENYAYRYNSLAHYRRLLDDLKEGHLGGHHLREHKSSINSSSASALFLVNNSFSR
ncbi:uncharacterized protein DS421_1g19630 [Arachis hypogaea]|nr:uncharacterized protein DS421_1g19630 [Arachis hypogaea]